MNKQSLEQLWDQFRQKYGVYLRLLEAFPEDRLHSRPIAGMRTPAEIAVHISASVVRDIAQGVEKGAITANEAGEDTVAAGLRSKDELLAFVRDSWKTADGAVKGIGDAELQAMVPTPWNKTFPGWVAFHVMGDEFLHHRGQLYAFARASGAEPPFIWGFDQNEPGFLPQP
jgi:uncharacterized damage-inducible protein DinB